MNDSGSWAEGFSYYKQLKAVVIMNEFGSWGQCFRCYEQLNVVLDPQFCPSTLAFILRVSHAPNFFYMAPPWPPFGLVSIISPSFELGITHHFFMDSLFFKEYSIKISNFFLISSTSPQSFSSARVHWSMSEFRALRIVSIISLSSKFRIMHHFFYGLLVLQWIFCKNFNFFLNWLDRLATGSIGCQLVKPIEKNFEILTEYSLKNKESIKKMVHNSDLRWGRYDQNKTKCSKFRHAPMNSSWTETLGTGWSDWEKI